jgi:hypothetical protein
VVFLVKWTDQQQMEYESRQAFRIMPLAEKWIVRDRVPDISIDLEVEIVEERIVTNKVLWLQLKSTNSIEHRYEAIPYLIETKYLRHYESCLLPVVILLWVKSENSFYYLFAQRYIQEKLSGRNPS